MKLIQITCLVIITVSVVFLTASQLVLNEFIVQQHKLEIEKLELELPIYREQYKSTGEEPKSYD